MPTQHIDLTFRVLVTKEADQYVAHALELDLVGTGGSAEEAQKELTEAILCQLSFSANKGEAALIPHPAPAEYFELWERAQQSAVRSIFSHAKNGRSSRAGRAASIEISSQQVRTASRRQFQPGLVCA